MTSLNYLGHACFSIVRDDGAVVLVDPWLNDNPARACRAEDLDRVDLILVTHGGFDHLGDTFDIARRTGAMIFSSVDVNFAAKLRGLPRENLFSMVSGAQRSHAGFSIQAVEAHHVSILEVDGQYISGQPLGYIVKAGEDAPSVYHMGDTSVFSDLALIAQLYAPDVALIGMGGDPNLPHEMTPAEAALAVELTGVRRAVPMHYEPGSPDPQQFVESVRGRGLDVQVDVLNPGDSLTLDSVAGGVGLGD